MQTPFPLLRMGLVMAAILFVLAGLGLLLDSGIGAGRRAPTDRPAAPPARDTDDEPAADDSAVASAPAPGGALCRVEASGVALPDDVHEASGVAPGRRDSGVLWTHNDSGDPVLAAVGADGRPRARVSVTGASLVDWEDVAAGPCPAGSCLYVGDIGDNGAARDRITVYRVLEPGAGETRTQPAEALHATYPDGPQDAEALFVMPDGGVYVVTKGETGPVAVYRFPQPLRPGATVRLERVRELAAGEARRSARITGASASPDGRWVALRTLREVAFYPAASFATGGSEPLRYDVSGLDEAQGEGVGFGPAGTVYLTSEGGKKEDPATLARLACSLPS
ncbi:MAG TPA: hypothetical protein VHG91_19720 [Longimicrobium sp.]|nr:hypothetical protein [Longimicrobium sp.]